MADKAATDLVATAETDQATAVAAAIIGAIRGGVQPQANDVSLFLRRKGIDTEPGQIAAMVAAYLRSWTPDAAELAALAGDELARMRGDTGDQSPEHLARQIRQVFSAAGSINEQDVGTGDTE